MKIRITLPPTLLLSLACVLSKRSVVHAFLIPQTVPGAGAPMLVAKIAGIKRQPLPTVDRRSKVKVTAATAGQSSATDDDGEPGLWPCFDELDKRLIKN
jgi:hypothetical protein